MDIPSLASASASGKSSNLKVNNAEDPNQICAHDPVFLTPPPKTARSQRRFHFAILTVVMFSSTIPSLHAQASAALAKIEPHLAAAIAPGGNSDALIVLSEQADLSGADNLPTKLEKGQYVYARLREVAERTQAPLRKRLDEMGIPYESFFSVNMIKVNASRDQLYELAGRDEVERLEPNPKVKSAIMPASGTLSTLSAESYISTPSTGHNVERSQGKCAASMGDGF